MTKRRSALLTPDTISYTAASTLSGSARPTAALPAKRAVTTAGCAVGCRLAAPIAISYARGQRPARRRSARRREGALPLQHSEPQPAAANAAAAPSHNTPTPDCRQRAPSRPCCGMPRISATMAAIWRLAVELSDEVAPLPEMSCSTFRAEPAGNAKRAERASRAKAQPQPSKPTRTNHRIFVRFETNRECRSLSSSSRASRAEARRSSAKSVGSTEWPCSAVHHSSASRKNSMLLSTSLGDSASASFSLPCPSDAACSTIEATKTPSATTQPPEAARSARSERTRIIGQSSSVVAASMKPVPRRIIGPERVASTLARMASTLGSST
mmetsp:Transcript_14296/g.36323  ORF Transcript_14296/g.36323 Transcript_14296/m.36323 type:complete len:327 (+) Transcript_14296:345-1325(+)